MEQDSKRAILAVVLSGIVLFGWQYLFPTQNIVVPTKSEQVSSNVSPSQKTATVKQSEVQDTTESKAEKVEVINLASDKTYYKVDNNLQIIQTKSVNTEITFPEVFEENSTQLYITISGNEIKPFFNFTQISENKFSFESTDKILRGSLVLDENGLLNVNLSSTLDFKYRFVTKSKEIEVNMNKMSQYLVLSKDLDTYSVGDDDSVDAAKIKWFASDFDYHFIGYIFSDPTLHKIKFAESGTMEVRSINAVKGLAYKNLFIQKNYDDLLKLGDKLDLAVDFGIMSIIAVPILRGLQFFYTIFPNYGISIILLTILIRMLTFPLQYKSFKSMKKMQVIQPELTKIREKYKSDPQQMQKETMALFKRAGANPLGGCLPLLLQMPIFFAFYKVLYTAVELVNAEFGFWIIDLSQKDPYYVLPVLMSLAMFLNMKLTPQTTADPAQQKIMMFMPLFFGFIMKDLPSGLTLYIFISTIVGMLQQLFVYKRVS